CQTNALVKTESLLNERRGGGKSLLLAHPYGGIRPALVSLGAHEAVWWAAMTY
ncbi:hypothetical protein TorRG33x02_251150, partial [Trema orientale]